MDTSEGETGSNGREKGERENAREKVKARGERSRGIEGTREREGRRETGRVVG